MITIKKINPTDVISDAPNFFNEVFKLIETHINDLEKVIDEKTKIINLTDQSVTVGNGSMIINALALVGKSGTIISLSPGGKEEVFSLNAQGELVATKLVATSEEEPSEIKNLIVENAECRENLSVEGLLDISKNVGVAANYAIVAIGNSNISGVASNPVKINDKQIVYLDYSNGDANLNGLQDVKFDISDIADGQHYKFVCLRTNVIGSQKIYNGSTGNEMFAFINPLSGGFQSIDSNLQPEFKPMAQIGKYLSWMECQWTNIGNGIYRFVILESENMINVGK